MTVETSTSENLVPKYRLIAGDIEKMLRQFAPGAQFHTDRELARQFHTTRVTVARSLDLLVRRGLLERRAGSGTFVVGSDNWHCGKKRIGIICHEVIVYDEIYSNNVLHVFHDFWSEKGFSVITLTGTPRDYFRLVEEFELSGVMIFVPRKEFAPGIAALKAAGVPVVAIGYALPELEQISFGSDHEAIGRRAVDYLVKLGHRRLGLISRNYTATSSQLFRHGYELEMWNQHLPIHPNWLVDTQWDNRQCPEPVRIQNLLRGENAVTAVIVNNLYIGLQLYDTAAHMGVRIPEDVSVIGYGDAPFARYFTPPLTVMRQNIELFTGNAVGRLYAEVAGGEFTPVEGQSTELVERESCRAIAE